MTDNTDDAIRMDMPGRIFRLEAKPGDRFVLKTRTRVSASTAEAIQQYWQHFMPGAGPLLILDDSADLAVVSKAPDPLEEWTPILVPRPTAHTIVDLLLPCGVVLEKCRLVRNKQVPGALTSLYEWQNQELRHGKLNWLRVQDAPAMWRLTIAGVWFEDFQFHDEPDGRDWQPAEDLNVAGTYMLLLKNGVLLPRARLVLEGPEAEPLWLMPSRADATDPETWVPLDVFPVSWAPLVDASGDA